MGIVYGCLRYCLWCCFSPKCTLYTCGKYCGTMNDEHLESKALYKVQQFHECSFSSNRRHAAGKLLVKYINSNIDSRASSIKYINSNIDSRVFSIKYINS